MSHTADRNTDAGPVCHRDHAKALLAAAIEHHLTGQGQLPDRPGDGPWDLWWACYRAQRSAAELRLDPPHPVDGCADSAIDASRKALCTPPAHPDQASSRRCSCLLNWARSMRRPAPDIAWPQWRLTVAMVKPGSDPVQVRGLLAPSHTVLEEFQRSLAPADARRLYPEAYGREYVARRDDYLTSAPVTVLVLLASASAAGKAKGIEADIRRRLGEGDVLRNHLHMPDSPGNAFADIEHLTGIATFTRFYERYERDRATQRLARYRALLEQPGAQHRTG
ncbi:MAG: hypothetical protein ACRDTF_09050 [Pseudonocardiaceae bacterium]